MQPLFAPADLDRFREALDAADYGDSGISTRLDDEAAMSAGRGDFRAALTATSDLDPQATLIRLFVCGVSVPETAAAKALAPLSLDAAKAAGLVVDAGDGCRAGMALEIYGPHWLLSDLPASPERDLDAEHVLGVGRAAATLAGSVVRREVDSALDVGTGSGIQALHLSGHAAQVTATDVSRRALQFAATNAVLNNLDWELLHGDMLAPVASRRFDLVVCNPPFVIGDGASSYTYRDSGRVADGVCAELASAAARVLRPGGVLQFLANWPHVRGRDWTERVADWFEGTELDVWAIQRDVLDPLEYVRHWQRDAGGEPDPHRAAEWLDWFDANDVEAVGFGIVSARLGDGVEGEVVCEDLRHQVEPPFGERVADWFDARAQLAALTPQTLLDARLRVADGVNLQQEAALGVEGWEVERQYLTAAHGLRGAEEIDPLLVSFLGGCRGDVDVRTQVGLLAAAHEAPAELMAASLDPVIRRLVQRGLLQVA